MLPPCRSPLWLLCTHPAWQALVALEDTLTKAGLESELTERARVMLEGSTVERCQMAALYVSAGVASLEGGSNTLRDCRQGNYVLGPVGRIEGVAPELITYAPRDSDDY